MNRLQAIGTLLTVSLLLAGCRSFHPAPLTATEAGDAFEVRSLGDAGLAYFLAQNQSPPHLPWQPPAKWDLTTLTMVAFYYHPGLEIIRAQWGIARAGEKTAGGRPNPIVGIQPAYNFNAVSGVTPWLPGVTFDLPIETAGKRGKRIARAEHLAEAARLNVVAAAWQVRANLRAALLDNAAAHRRIVLLQNQIDGQRRQVEVLEQRLNAGAVSQLEVTLVRLALLKSSVDLAEAKRQATETRSRLAEAVGLPLKGIEGAEFDFELTPALNAGSELTTPEARRHALHSRADLLALLAEYAAADSAFRLEIAKQYPDLHVNPGYLWDQGESKWTVGLSVELPLLNRNQGPIAEAEAKRAEVEARFVALQAKVIGETDRALANRALMQEQLNQIETLVRALRGRLESLQAAFNAGGADQLELRAAQVENHAVELARLDVQIKLQQALGQLEAVTQWPGSGIDDASALSGYASSRKPAGNKPQAGEALPARKTTKEPP